MELKQCPKCKKDVTVTCEKCPYCGHNLIPQIIADEKGLIKCSKCKRDITSTSEKCGYCGYQLKSIIIDEVEENRAHNLLTVSRIFLIVIPLIIIVAVIGNFRKCSRNNIEQIVNSEEVIQPKIDTVKIKLPNADVLLSKAKVLYKKGKYNESDVVLTQIIKDYANSTAAIEASKLKITVVNAIRDKWTKEQKNRIQDPNKENGQQNLSSYTGIQKFVSTGQAIVNVDYSTVKGYDKIYLTFDYIKNVITLSNPSKGSKFTFKMVSGYKEYGTMVGDTYTMNVTSTDAPAVKRFFFSLDVPSLIFMENKDGKTTTFGELTRL